MQVLKFSASWCAPCKALSAALTRFPAVRVIEVDIDAEPTAKTQWGLRSVPTLVVIDDNDNEMDRMVGFTSTKQLEDFIKKNSVGA